MLRLGSLQVLEITFRFCRFLLSPTYPNGTPFRRKDCKETFILSDRVWLSSAEARVEETQSGSV